MCECCRQVEAEVVSKSRNKIHQTWGPPFSRALYICITHQLCLPSLLFSPLSRERETEHVSCSSLRGGFIGAISIIYDTRCGYLGQLQSIFRPNLPKTLSRTLSQWGESFAISKPVPRKCSRQTVPRLTAQDFFTFDEGDVWRHPRYFVPIMGRDFCNFKTCSKKV